MFGYYFINIGISILHWLALNIYLPSEVHTYTVVITVVKEDTIARLRLSPKLFFGVSACRDHLRCLAFSSHSSIGQYSHRTSRFVV